MGQLYSPPDIAEAHDVWGCNCGPATLAAILRVPAMQVVAYFPNFEDRRYVNPTQMREALEKSGLVQWYYATPERQWPRYGLAFLQIEGPWEAPGVPVGAAYQRTHWVAAALVSDGTDSGEHDDYVYDINAGNWLIKHQWQSEIMSRVVASHKRATGWRVRSGIEVRMTAMASRTWGKEPRQPTT